MGEKRFQLNGSYNFQTFGKGVHGVKISDGYSSVLVGWVCGERGCWEAIPATYTAESRFRVTPSVKAANKLEGTYSTKMEAARACREAAEVNIATTLEAVA
jgi:hypothetical protein